MSASTREDMGVKHFKQRLESVAKIGISETQMVKAYQMWAETFSQDLLESGYSGHTLTAKYMCESYSEDQRRHVRIIDVGAGTGLIGEELKKAGFTNVDGLDPSQAMLDKAREKDVYCEYLVEFITEEPLDIPDDTYDGLCGCGMFMEAGHVPVSALREMIRLVKPGGYIVLVSRTNLLNHSHYNELEPLMDTLEHEGKWRKVDRIVGPNLYMDRPAISWRYQIM